MKKMKKIINISVATLFVSVLAFNVYLNLTNPFQFVTKQVIAQNTGTETGTSTSTPNYAYFEKLVNVPFHDEYAVFSTGAKVLIRAVPAEWGMNYREERGLVAIIKGCEGPSFARCDQNRVGEIVATFVGGYDGTR